MGEVQGAGERNGQGMILRVGNMWDETAHVVMVTTNATVRRIGTLVMGRGAAKEAADRNPRLTGWAGRRIWELEEEYGKKPVDYGLLITPMVDRTAGSIWLFQVKWDWWNKASVGLIEKSVDEFMDVLDGKSGRAMQLLARGKVSLNFPGIGNGGLGREEVLPLIARLPNNVTVWEKG